MKSKQTYQQLEKQIAELKKQVEISQLNSSLQNGLMYHSLFENMSEGFARCQMIYENNQAIDFIYLEVNRAFEKLTGLKNVVGKPISEFLTNFQIQNPEILELYGRVSKTGISEKIEAFVAPLERWFSISVYSSKKGEFLVIFDNISERKQAEESLFEKESLLAKAEFISNQGFWKWDIVNDYWSFSHSWLKIHGLKHSGISKKELMELAHPDDVSKIEEAMLNALDNNLNYSLEHRIIRKDDGKIRFIRALGEVQNGTNGKPEYLIGIARDITDQKKAEQELKSSEEKFKNFFDTNPSATFVWKVFEDDFILFEVNEAAQKITGRKASGFIGLRASSIYNDEPFMLEKLMECYTNKSVIEFEHYYKNRNRGTFDWIEFRLAFIEPDLILLYSDIITERKQIEEDFRNSQKTLISALESMTDAVFISDLKGNFIEFNEAFATFHRINDKSECTKALKEWPKIIEVYNLDGSVLPLDKWVVNRAINGEKSSNEEYIFERKDSGERWYGIYNFSPILDQNGTIIGSVTVARDITERKNAELELVASKTKYQDLFVKMMNAFAIHEMIFNEKGEPIDYKFLEVNPAWEKVVGIKAETVIDKTIREIMPDVEDSWLQTYGRIVKTGISEECEDYNKATRKYYHIYAYRTEPGKFAVLFNDITERKQTEAALLQAKEKAEESEKKLKLLNRITSEMILLPDMQSIYKFIAETLHKHYPNTIVLVVSIEESKQETRLEAISGLDNQFLHKIVKISGFDPVGKVYNLTDLHKNYFKSGSFVEFDGDLAKFSESEFPAIAANFIEKLIGLHKIYSIGINKDDHLLAAIHFFTHNNQVITDSNFIEVFIKQSGLILQKKNDEKTLENAKEKAEESEANITAIIEGTNNSIWAFNKNYEILYINHILQEEFLQTFGVLLKTGMNLVEVLPETFRPLWKSRYDRVLANEQFTIEDAVPVENGTIYIEVSFNPIVKNGQVIGGSCLGNNITARKLAELELIKAKEKAEESERQLKLISDNFVNGMIYQVAMLDENRRQFNYISKNVEQLYGCTAQEAKEDANLIYGKLHPDDIEGLIKKEKEALRNMTTFETEARTITPNGNIRWAYYFSKPRVINGIVCWDGIEIDITERKQMELELRKAKEKAEESDRLKSAFLANMSHEIRTPMNGILGFTSLLKEPGLKGEDQLKFISIIEKSGERMLNTINDIIDISKIEAGQVDIIVSEINLNKQLDELLEFFLPEAKKKNIQLSITNRMPDQQAIFESDKEKINSILINLIKNAIKYTPSGSIKIGYSIKEKGEQNELELYVKDTGIGIPKERQKAIFNRFEQADIEDRQVFEGSGLGLAIAKAYAEMLSGKIWVESEEGVGSQFYFTIPFKTINREKLKNNSEDSDNPQTVKKNLKLLIADDDEFVVTFLRIVLQKYVKEMLIAKTGIEAVEMCLYNPDIDVVLMDIKIPGINGYEATRQIREFNKTVFIVAQTAYAQSGDREKSIKAGCDDYISKPIKKEKLWEILSNRF